MADEKTEIIRARIDKATKADFEAIATSFDKTPSDQLRELIEEFIGKYADRIDDRVVVHIYQPAKYDYGAWRVTVKLRNPGEGLWHGSEIPFPLPELPKRRIASDPEYVAIVVRNNEIDLGGKFVLGEWRGHIYTNGVPENENPTPLEMVKEELWRTVIEIIDRFGRKPNQ
ncbi:hypothetical protein RHE_CH01988 [Rhizobium etli CFN 42]|uniref:Uncharacterized protein n=1 Tax=Rhizobium etli (strain ATCC 51251 / DSM 11541 / JCM 21823 / NBRC 15573 / CFN 42) TaxID=347834 RepID=Q2K8R3_RHIEC|nr:hypothetical protein [Rhizobium etli]ABC90773.1 hypothetical protein RHE_CH01988 [Rhizobium etli CFN 42]